MSFQKVIKAWTEAAADLHLKIEAPFVITTDTGKIKFPLLVHDFGLEKGTVILDMDDYQDKSDIPGKYGYYCSCLGSVYEKYDRELFKDTLEDWGYYGYHRQKPSRYEGKYYKEEK